jgi:hypothetical protein
MAFYCGFSNLFATTDLKDFEASRANQRRPTGASAIFPRFFISVFPGFHFLSAKHRQQKGRASDFVKFRKGDCNIMKTLSVLFTVALLCTANALAAHLKRVNALPVHSVPVSSIHFHKNQH